MAAEQVEEHLQQRHGHEHAPEADEDQRVHQRTAHAKRAALVPLIASTLSPVTSPVASPVSSPCSQQLRPSPFSIVPVTSSSSSSFSTSSSSCTCTSSSDSLSSLTSLSSLSSSPPSPPPAANKCACRTLTDMTVAKLDPGTTTGPISPSASFSPPTSPLAQKKGIYSTSTTTTTTTTSTTVKTSSSNNSSSATLMDESTTTTHHSETSSKTASQPRRLGPKMNPIYKGLRAIVWAFYFNLGASLISITQVLSLPLALIAPRLYHWHITKTQGHFGAFLLRMNQLFAPSDIVLTGDESVRGIVKVYQGRNLKEEAREAYSGHGEDIILDMPERMVFIANHQIYSDWMYLWCFSYFAEKHRALKIILRGDLTWIPVFGCFVVLQLSLDHQLGRGEEVGMRFFDFIFLKRNDWAHDRRAIEENLDRVKEKDPLWLVVFPEGTVVSKETRLRSVAFSKKAGLSDHRHVLLPRTSGLFVCINKLRGSVEYLYDATVGYSNVEYGEIPQELYPLPGLYVNKAQPKEINMHLRRFAIKDIPTSEPEFVEWVRTRWVEKDELLEEFYTKGRFPSQLTAEDIGEKEVKKAGGPSEGQSIRIPLKARSMMDYLMPSIMNLIALPALAFAMRYAVQQVSSA
ncbi:hypothetical protein EC968_008927 [Mortierella alpina]|nr:hypothetical protein EC968_008927 [Mortierella alpina]